VNVRLGVLVGFVGFFLLCGAWAVAMPVDGTYDESQHIVRGYAAVDGQWQPHGPQNQSFTVPATLLPENVKCMQDRGDRKPASCQRARPGDGPVSIDTYVARYNPTYYLAVGLPLKLWPNLTGIVLSRLLSALLCAMMLAGAAWVGLTVGNRLLVAGVALVATPMVVNLAGSVNPNGLEICAGALLFASLIGLVTGDGVPRRTALALAAVAAFFLVTVRHIGPVLLAVDLAAVALVAGLGRVRAETRRRDTRAWLGGGVLAGFLAFGGWLLVAPSPVGVGLGKPLDIGPTGIVRGLIDHRFEFYVRQIVGQFGYGETTMSPAAILLWYVLLAALVLPAWWRGSRRVRLALTGLTVVGFGMLVALEFYFVPTSNWFSHGRYALPVLCGVVLIAAATDPRRPRWWWPVVLVLGTAPVHLYALVRAVSRFAVGVDASFSPFGGEWSPPLGAAPPLAAVLVGVGLLTACAWARPTVAQGEQIGTSAEGSTRTVSAD
jgi:hypothetical protein